MVFLSGCGGKVEEKEVVKKSPKKDYDLFVYNSDISIGKAFREMCDEYTKRTGVIIRTVTPTEEDNTIENLEAYINSEYPPDVFTVNNLQEVSKWQSSENIWDFNNATEESFKEVVNKIPESLRLSSNTSNSFGVPCTVSGWGLVVDPKMIASLFGGDKYRKVLQDLQACSYEEFSYFVNMLNSYILTGSSAEFTLNGKSYSFAGEKGELSQKLKGIFSFAGGSTETCGSYFMNHVLAGMFNTASKAYIANESQIEGLSTPLMRLAEGMELLTSNVAGEEGMLSRGSDFISNTRNSLSQSMKNFVGGKSVFLAASTKDFESISIFDSLVAKRCVMIPLKMPISEIDVSLPSDSEFNLNLHKALTVYSPRYYCINAKSSEREKKSAQDFLMWLQTSELAEKYMISEFGYVPYDLEDGSVLDNPLERSMVEYIKSSHYIPGVFMGAPDSWCGEVMGKYIVNQLFVKPSWSLEDYEGFATHGVDKWKELMHKED